MKNFLWEQLSGPKLACVAVVSLTRAREVRAGGREKEHKIIIWRGEGGFFFAPFRAKGVHVEGCWAWS